MLITFVLLLFILSLSHHPLPSLAAPLPSHFSFSHVHLHPDPISHELSDSSTKALMRESSDIPYVDRSLPFHGICEDGYHFDVMNTTSPTDGTTIRRDVCIDLTAVSVSSSACPDGFIYSPVTNLCHNFACYLKLRSRHSQISDYDGYISQCFKDECDVSEAPWHVITVTGGSEPREVCVYDHCGDVNTVGNACVTAPECLAENEILDGPHCVVDCPTGFSMTEDRKCLGRTTDPICPEGAISRQEDAQCEWIDPGE